MKKSLLTIILATVLTVASYAQTILINFTAANPNTAVAYFSANGTNWGAANYSYSGGVMTIGGTADVTGSISGGLSYLASGTSFNATALPLVTASFERNNSGAAGNFVLTLLDSLGTTAATAIFSTGLTGSWVTQSVAYTASGGGNLADITYWTIGASGAPGTSVNMSFTNNITMAAVPEPATYAAILGVLALGLVAYRRRNAA